MMIKYKIADEQWFNFKWKYF